MFCEAAQITQAIHGFDCDLASQSSFSVLYFESPRLAHRHAAFVRLSRPANLGFLEARVQFLVFVCGPIREVVLFLLPCPKEWEKSSHMLPREK